MEEVIKKGVRKIRTPFFVLIDEYFSVCISEGSVRVWFLVFL